MSDSPVRAAVIPFSSDESDKQAMYVCRGLALELIDWLKQAEVDCILLTSTHVDDDGHHRRLVNFSEDLDTATISEIVNMAQEEQPDDDTDSLPDIQIVFSGYLKREGENYEVDVQVTDAAGAYARGRTNARITAGGFGREVNSLFLESARLAGVSPPKSYNPGTERLAAWNQLMLTRALRLAGEVGAIGRDVQDVFEPAIKAARLDRSCTAARERLCELAEVLVFERGYDAQKALHALDDVTRLVGPNWRSIQVRAQLLETLGKPAEAAKHYARLLKGEHEAPGEDVRGRAALAAGRSFNAANRHEEAARVLARAMKYEPLRVEAIVESGVASLGLGEGVVAERLWTRALELDPVHVVARLRLAQYYAHQGQVDKAAEQYGRVLEGSEVPREVFGDAAEFFYNNRLFETAETAARRFAEEYPGEAIAHLLCASSLNALSRHEEAGKALDQAELCAGVSTLKDLMLRQRRWAEFPQTESRLQEAAEHVFTEKVALAADMLGKLAAQHPDFWEARMLYGIALRRLERFEEARVEFEAVLTGRSVPSAEKELTGVYSQLGQPEKALECARRALDQNPDDAELLANYAAALLENDELTDAYKFARRAQDLAPDDELTRSLIEQILARSEKRGFLANLKAAAKFVTKKLKRRRKKPASPPEDKA